MLHITVTVLVSEDEVFKLLKGLKRTAAGPDELPFWLWKTHAEIFATCCEVIPGQH
jgi:hypothetical protein